MNLWMLEFKLSHLIQARVEYKLRTDLQPTLGLGYLNTGDKIEMKIGGQLGIEEVELRDNYIIIPVGIRATIGVIYIHPEFAPGINVSKKRIVERRFVDGTDEKKKEDIEIVDGDFNDITLPFILSVGTEVELENLSFLLGLKAYYSVNKVVTDVPRNNHYYGLGLHLGVKI